MFDSNLLEKWRKAQVIFDLGSYVISRGINLYTSIFHRREFACVILNAQMIVLHMTKSDYSEGSTT